MTSLLLTGIGELVTNDPALGDGSPLGLLHDAAVVVTGGWPAR
jgi:imidazolonepropionase